MWPRLLRPRKLVIFIGMCIFITGLIVWSAPSKHDFTHADVSSTHARLSSEPTLVNVPPSTRHISFRFGAAVDVYTELTTQRTSRSHEGGTGAPAAVVASLMENRTSASDAVVTNVHVPIVHVWSKAAIGDYLWHHLLEGTTIQRDGGLWRDGNMTVGSGPSRAQLWFRSGWSVRDSTALRALMPKHVVMVLNGHEPDLARKAQVIVSASSSCLILNMILPSCARTLHSRVQRLERISMCASNQLCTRA